MNTVRIDLPFPPSTNALWKKGQSGMYRAPRYMTWINAAGIELKLQKPVAIVGNYAIRIDLERKDRKKRDADNFIKAVSDLLVAHGVVADDSLAEIVTIRWNTKVSGCRVTLRELSAPASVRRAA